MHNQKVFDNAWVAMDARVQGSNSEILGCWSRSGTRDLLSALTGEVSHSSRWAMTGFLVGRFTGCTGRGLDDVAGLCRAVSGKKALPMQEAVLSDTINNNMQCSQ